jgi:hypothetical protein
MRIRNVLKSALLSTGVVSAFFLSSCAVIEEQKPVDIRDVDSVVIYRRLPDHTFEQAPALSAPQLEEFLDDLNSAPSDGFWKFLQSYKITVYQEDHTERHFRANGSRIKENSDKCFEMPGEHYFEDLWERARK